MDTEASLQIRSLMSRFRSGDPDAAGALVAHLYPELRRIASTKMRAESPDHTWTPTVLVNELYLELVKIRALRAAGEDASERKAFLGLAGHIMRRLLIHHARPLYRQARKAGGGELERSTDPVCPGPEPLAQVEDLLEKLGTIDPKLRAVVELRVFEGKTADETADAMGCSVRTVYKHWQFATHWHSK